MPREQKVKPCDNCKVKKRKCDGNLPCNTCVHSRKLTAPCSYSDNGLTIGSADAADIADKVYLIKRVKELEQIIADLQSTHLATPPSSSSSTSLEAFLATSADAPMPSYNDFGFDSLFLPGQNFNPDQLYPSPFLFDSAWQMPAPIEFDQGALETHLLSLAPTFLCGVQTTGENGAIISPLERKLSISSNLKKAICFHAVFISSHPSLFSTSTAPSFQERLKIANQYFECKNSASYSMEGLCTENNFASNRELCDEISCLVLHCVTNFSIGNGSKAIDLISSAFLMVRFYGLLNPSSFGLGIETKTTTMDDISVFLPSKIQPVVLTDREKTDRMVLLCQLLACDLFQSMASANGFLTDDSLIPDTNYQQEIVTGANQLGETSGLNATFTIWENTPFAATFSQIMTHPITFNYSALFKAQSQIQMLKFFRKVMTWSRANSNSQSSFTDQFMLHSSCLKIMAHSVGIQSLSSFMFGKLDSDIPRELYITPNSLELNISTAEFLAMLCYIHYPSMSDTTRKFPIGGETNYLSIDILFGVVRSLHFVIRRACGVQVSCSISKSLPPPSICHAVFALLAYVICSSVAVAFQSAKADYQQKVIVFGLLAEINHTLWGIGGVWPIARLFHQKLSQRLGIKPN